MRQAISLQQIKSANMVFSVEGVDLLVPKLKPAGVAEGGSGRSEEGGNKNLQLIPESEFSADSIQSSSQNLQTTGTAPDHGAPHFVRAAVLKESRRTEFNSTVFFSRVFVATNVIGAIIASGVAGGNCESSHAGDRAAINSCLERDVPIPIAIVVASSLFSGLCVTAFKTILQNRRKTEENQEKFSPNVLVTASDDVENPPQPFTDLVVFIPPKITTEGVFEDKALVPISEARPISLLTPDQGQFFTPTPRVPLQGAEVHNIVLVPREEMIAPQPDSKTSLREKSKEIKPLELSTAPVSMRYNP